MLLDWIMTPLKYASLYLGFIRQDVKGRFAGSVMGLLWAVLSPVSNVLIYFFVFSIIMKVKLPEVETGTTSFIVYLLSGLIPWMAFSESLNRATNILLDNASIISKVSFPVQVLPFSIVSVGFLLNGIGFVFFMVFLVIRGYAQSSWCMLPVITFCFFLFTLGIAAILSSVTVFIRDIRELVVVLMQLWFYATPILYPFSMIPERFHLIMHLNPALPFITSFRQCLLQGQMWPDQLLLSGILALFSCLLGGYCFMRLKPAFGDVV